MKLIKIKPLIYSGTLEELSPEEQHLISDARVAIKNSFATESDFNVGCSILLDSGETISGANQEDPAYGSTMCAERTTIWSAWNKGQIKFEMLAVTGKLASEIKGQGPIKCCGACLQVIAKAEERSGKKLIILMDGFDDLHIRKAIGVGSLLTLPFSFVG